MTSHDILKRPTLGCIENVMALDRLRVRTNVILFTFTDRQTDRRSFSGYTSACIACYAGNKKVQQSWQTSALAMYLPLARLISMPVIFCLLPSSSIVILVFYLFSTGISDSEQHVWELWVWIQSIGLTLPLRVTPMNNPITLVTSTVAWLHFCCADSYMRSSANFLRKLFASPLDAELGPDFNAKWPFKVIKGQEQYCGLECEGF